VQVWGAQLELGSTASTYQQIVTPEISFLQYQSQPVMYTDSAGTTPVTAVEQAVGLMLDKSKGLVPGSESVVTPYSGTVSGSWAISSTEVTRNGSSGGQANLTLSITPSTTKTYQVQFTVSNLSGDTFYYRLGSGGSAIQVTSNGQYTARVIGGGGSTSIIFAPWAGSAGQVTISNISVRELPGNHAFQTSSTKRPVLRARYNLLTYSEQFDNAAWSKTGATVTANAAVAPDGTNTADKLVENTAFGAHQVFVSFTFAVNVAYSWSVYAKAAERSWLWVNAQDGSDNRTWFDLANGAVGTNSAGNAASITSVGNGWYRCSVSRTTAASSGFFAAGLATADNTATYTGDGASGAFIWGADLRPASQATGLIGPTYQRIAAATDYDVVGFLPYLQFDGFDDALTTNSIDFTATDEMTVFAGVRKLSDAAIGIVTELSADLNSNNGAFFLLYPRSASFNEPVFTSKGTAAQQAANSVNTYPAPITNVLTGIGDISGDVATLRINGAQAATNTNDQGTGNFGNYPLFVGARNQTSAYFNGWLTQLIGVGAATSASQIVSTESWVNVRTGAY
jgi:hypothetical protein